CTPSTEQGLDRMRDRIRALAQMADAINVTSNHAGVPRVAALSLARCVGEYQGEAILHLCGRDLDPRSYLDALVGLSANEVHNVLCLTGDWPARAEPSAGNRTPPRTAHYFPLEAAQMIYEASHLRQFGASALADLNARPAPRSRTRECATRATARSSRSSSRRRRSRGSTTPTGSTTAARAGGSRSTRPRSPTRPAPTSSSSTAPGTG
ncbi:MAG: methylenetetrahydrofolate reductase, partial [Planctomycetaceae bacterium]|nr:methylenetetrahydrofolate reductase [Planctomycetaceae bacterium]